jgi:hypothetical protein
MDNTMDNSPPDEEVKLVAKTSWGTLSACFCASLFLPAACAVVAAMGLLEAEPELDIYSIWAPDTGSYAEDKAYLKDLKDTTEIPESGTVSCLFKSIPRDGQSHLRKDNVVELMDRMKAMEAVEVTYKDNTYTYNDVCYGGSSVKEMYLGYTLPCITIAAVHSYAEAGWEMGIIPLANDIWYEELVPIMVRPLINYFLLALDFPPAAASVASLGLPNDALGQPAECIPSSLCSTYMAAAAAQVAAAGGDADAQATASDTTSAACCVSLCKVTCAYGSLAATANGINPRAYEDFPDCMRCMADAERKIFAALEDPVLAQAWGFVDQSYGDWEFSLIHDQFIDADSTSYKDVWIYTQALGGVQSKQLSDAQAGLATLTAAVAAFTAANDTVSAAAYQTQADTVSGQVAALQFMNAPQFEQATLGSLYSVVKGVTNTFTAQATALGFAKGLQKANPNVAAGEPNVTEEELHGWASVPVSGWNPLRNYPFEMMFGTNTKDENGTLTDVEGLQAVYLLADGKHFKEKVASSMREQGPRDADGNVRPAVTITDDDADEILTQMKIKMEEVWNANWDKSDSETGDVNKYAAFTGGIGGTFYRSLKAMTEDSLIPSIVSYGAIVVVSILLMFSPSLTESKMLVSLFGALFSIVAFSGALGLTVLFGSKLMFTSVWTLPFLLVGLGVDDMYVILTTLILEGGDTAAGFVKAMKGCLVPVTMTSFTNAGMFGMLMFVSVPAVREMGKIAMISIGLQYLAMVTAFPCICFLDMVRTSSGRLDCLCCCKGTRPDESVKNLMYKLVYKPVLGCWPARLIIIAVSLGAVAVGVIGTLDAEPGGGLKDFFQPGTAEYEYMVIQEDYFDISWPLEVNFGALEYTNPEVQMHMIDIYESVIATPYSTKVDTKSLWSASLALWGTPDCMDVGMGEKCGKDFGCEAEWVENTRGLKLDTADPTLGAGVCKLGADIKKEYLATTPVYNATTEYCPVFSTWDDEKLAYCIGRWSTRGQAVTVYAVGASLNTSAPYDWTPTFPLKRTSANGNSMMYNVGISGNQGYIDAIETTRKLCDEDDTNGMRCWLQGVAYDFWAQYVDLKETSAFVAALAGAAGFVISFIFLAVSFLCDRSLSAGICGKISAALFASFIILLLCAMSIVTVFGITTLAGSSFTVLLLTSVLTAIGFSVEFAVHIMHRFLTAPQSYEKSIDRVNYAMDLLSLPMGCGFSASVVGLMCMLATDSNLVREVFFLPLILVQVVTFIFGTLFLPSVLAFIPCSCLQIGPIDGEKPVAETRMSTHSGDTITI